MSESATDVCECGHNRAIHTISTERNSIGRSWHHGCSIGYKSIPPYMVPGQGACQCSTFSKRKWWRTLQTRINQIAKPSEESL